MKDQHKLFNLCSRPFSHSQTCNNAFYNISILIITGNSNGYASPTSAPANNYAAPAPAKDSGDAYGSPLADPSPSYNAGAVPPKPSGKPVLVSVCGDKLYQP